MNDDLIDEDLETSECEEDFEALEAEDRSTPVDRPVRGCAVSFYVDNQPHHALCLSGNDRDPVLSWPWWGSGRHT